MMTESPRTRGGVLALHYSKPYAGIVLAITTLVALWGGYTALISVLSGNIVLVISGALALLLGAPVVLPVIARAINAFSHPEPVVTFNQSGVTDIRQGQAFVAWEDILQINLGAGNTYAHLCFEFRSESLAKQHVPRISFVRLLFRKTQHLSDWNVDLRPLRCSRLDVLRKARRLHQQAIRQKVVEANRDQPGWSGKL